MADTEISGLAALPATEAIATSDLLVLVNVSDTSMAASGTDVKVSNPILPLMHLMLWNLGVR